MITFLASILGDDILYLCSDINEHATKCTQRTGKQNNVNMYYYNFKSVD